MHLFSWWSPLPEEAIITTFHAILTQAAQPDRLEYWRVAEFVYRALAMDTRAQTRQGILLRAAEKEPTRAWLDTTIVEALQVVNGLGEAAEAWWQVRSAFGATRWCVRQREAESSWLMPLALAAQDHSARVQTCSRQALGEILAFTQAHEVTLRFPLDYSVAAMRFNRWQERQQRAVEREA